MLAIDGTPELSSLVRRPRWQARSACRSLDTQGFFPEGTGLSDEIRCICAACPVSVDCLTFALADPSLKGLWAGTTERGRARMRAAIRSESTAHH
jgi:WhiB family redox-sensing transcriptional regulator